jgi:hypothetical protein
MEDRQNVWDSWYLMTLDKLGKVECKFCNMVFHTTRIECFSIWVIDMMAMGILMFFYLGYRHDGNGHIGVDICPKTQAQVKPLFASCGGILLLTIR